MIPPHHMATHSGGYVNLLDPDPDTITLQDIAHALSYEPRFGGHSRRFYCVAQHSVLVSRLVPKEYALEGLLHDAHEAYCKDIPSPLKGIIAGHGSPYRSVEETLDTVIRRKYGLPESMSSPVADADRVTLASEAKVLMKEGEWLKWFDPPPETIDIGRIMSHRSAKAAFIRRFGQLASKAGIS